MKAIFLTIYLILFGASVLHAQVSTNTSGGNPASSEGNVSYSVGQAFYDTKSNSSLSVSEGVQQPYEITTTMGVDINEISLNVKIYPNPTQDILNLKVDFMDYTKYHYELYDASNKILLSKFVSSRNTVLSIASFPAALYYLKVTRDGKSIKVFKVLKTDK